MHIPFSILEKNINEPYLKLSFKKGKRKRYSIQGIKSSLRQSRSLGTTIHSIHSSTKRKTTPPGITPFSSSIRVTFQVWLKIFLYVNMHRYSLIPGSGKESPFSKSFSEMKRERGREIEKGVNKAMKQPCGEKIQD